MEKYVGFQYQIKAMEELEKGHEYARQLRQLMLLQSTRQDGAGDDIVASTTPSAEEEDLVAKVVGSFTNTLLLLNNNNNNQGLMRKVSDSSCCVVPSKSEDSQDSSCKSKSMIFPVKQRRGCYKRRKSSPHTWEKDSEKSTTEDGHAWRKYGQKIILNAKYPRNYFRCTHKFDQGCQATKQVQRIQDEPPLYRTKYYGHHTCRNSQNPDIIWDSHDLHLSNSSFLLSFDNSNSNTLSNPFFSSSSSFPDNSIKKEEEHCMNIKQENVNTNIPSSSSNDCYLLSPDDELTFESHHYHRDNVISSPLFQDPVFDALLFDPFEP